MERERQEVPALVPSQSPGTQSIVPSEVNKALLQATLKRLPFEEQVVLMLSLFHLKTYGEIATRLGVSEDYIRSLAERGLQKIDITVMGSQPQRHDAAA